MNDFMQVQTQGTTLRFQAKPVLGDYARFHWLKHHRSAHSPRSSILEESMQGVTSASLC